MVTPRFHPNCGHCALILFAHRQLCRLIPKPSVPVRILLTTQPVFDTMASFETARRATNALLESHT